MFGIGMPEMLLILAVALIVIGPKKLPDLAKSLGRAFGEFKKATSDLKESLEIDTDLSDVSKSFNEITDSVKETVNATDPYSETTQGDSGPENEEKTPSQDGDADAETQPIEDSDKNDRSG